MNIYIGNMNFNLSDSDLSNLFTQYGTVNSAKIILDRETGRSKGFGFVEMQNDEEAIKAINSLHENEVMGRKIIVNQAKPTEKKSGGPIGISHKRHSSFSEGQGRN